MARAGISQEQVFEAIEGLMQDNHPVTVSSVRDKLGSGSYSTISTHLAAWRKVNEGRKASDYPDMPDTVDKAFKQVWAMAWKTSQDSIQAEREALALARKKMELESKDLEDEIARLEAENIAQADKIKKADDELSEKEKTLSDTQNAVNALKIENARLDERVKSSENLAGELKDELNRLHSRLQEATGKKTEPRGRKKTGAE